MVTYYEVTGYGINSNLGSEKLVFTMGSNFDMDKDEYSHACVYRKAVHELKKLWGTDSVQLKSIMKEK